MGEAGYHVFSAGAVGHGQHVVNRCKPQRWSFAGDEGRIPIMHIRIRNQTAEAPQRGQSVGIPPLQPASRVRPFGRIAPRRVHFSKKGRVVRTQRDKGNTASILRSVKACELQKSHATSINPIDFRNMEACIGQDGRCHRLGREQIRPAFTLGCLERWRKFHDDGMWAIMFLDSCREFWLFPACGRSWQSTRQSLCGETRVVLPSRVQRNRRLAHLKSLRQISSPKHPSGKKLQADF